MQTKQPSLALFEQEVHASGLRLTSVRREIFELLLEATRPLSTQELTSKVTSGHFVSVYRSISALLKAGIVKEIPHGLKNHFELSDAFSPHHHHVTCESCGKSNEVHSERIEELMKQITLEAGLTPTKHHFEMYGICKQCKTENQR